MIADGYKAFVNKSDVASVVKEYVAIIAVRISGVGNGKLCSQLNTAISFDEAMYLFEGMWLFLYLLKIEFLSSPRRLRAKYTHRTNRRFVLCVFRPCRGQIYASVNYKCCRIYGCAGYGNEFVNGHLCVHSRWHNRYHF